jgi:hypothetical protein
MTARKSKPKPKSKQFPLIEWPIEQLRLVSVTVEPKVPVRAGQGILAGAEMPPSGHDAVNGASRSRLN